MTVATSVNRAQFLGSGSAGPFTFNMRFFANSEISVIHVDADDVETVLAEGIGYTLTGAGSLNGGVVTLTTALASGEALTVVRNLELLQSASIRNQGAFYPEIHEDTFDRLTMMLQQLGEQAARSIKMPQSASGDFTVPSGGRAGLVLGFGNSGEPVLLTPPVEAYNGVNRAFQSAEYASFAAAVAAIGSTPATLEFAEGQTVYAPIVIPDTLTLRPINGARINHTTHAITYHGSTEGWDDSQKFNGTGAVIMPLCRPEWIGAKGDGVADDKAIIQRCVENAKEVRIRKKTYMLSDTLTRSSLHAMKRLIGEGPASILKKTADTNPYILAVVSSVGVEIRDIAGDGARSVTNDYTNSKFVFYLAGCTNCVIDNVHAYGALADNIVIEGGRGNKVINSWAYNCNKDGIYSSGSEAVIINNNHCYGNGSNATGGGIAVAATWGGSVTGNICYDNVQFDILLSRGTRFVAVTGNSNGPFGTTQAPLSIYVLGEPMGGTLHGFDYGDGSIYYGASDCQIVGNNLKGEMRLELLISSSVTGNTIHGTNEYAINVLGSIGNIIQGNVLKNYTTWGVLLNSSAKNGTVQSGDNTVGGNTYGDTAKTVHNNGTGAGNVYTDNSRGAWTPVLFGGTVAGEYTLSGTSFGRFTKSGSQVTVTCNATITAIPVAGSGNLRVSGMLHPKISTLNFIGAVMSRGIDYTGTVPIVRFISDQVVYFPTVNDNATDVPIDMGGVSVGDTINFTITYEAAEP